jgi:hypothetical protein
MGAYVDPIYQTQNDQINGHEAIRPGTPPKEARQESFDNLPVLVCDKRSDISLCRASIVELRVVLVDKQSKPP